jgi:hypothetical protein
MADSFEVARSLTEEQRTFIIVDVLASLKFGDLKVYLYTEDRLGEPQWLSLYALKNEDGTWK